MCGISGVLTLDYVKINKIKNMNNCIEHRGPDDEGFFFWNKEKEIFAYGEDTVLEEKENLDSSIDKLKGKEFNLGFGHRRLSIIDVTSSAHQPMNYDEITITYNGEIYNYIELRNELLALGYKFETEGDTEVIIKSYLEWGESCVNYFNGMWAFSIWDKNKQRLFCSRDRLGEKPFYYYFNNKEFIFGSEIKQIIEYGVEPLVNENTMAIYLISGIHDVNEETFFKDIYVLQGGYNISIEFDNSRQIIELNKYKYWNVEDKSNELSLNFIESAKLIGSCLDKSIELRLRSDVEVGSCLSGGLDSSSVVTIATNKLEKDRKLFKTFTACYDNNKDIDERYYSDLIVKNSDCLNIKVKPNSEKLKKDFERLVWHQEEPFGSMGVFASWCVMESAHKEGIKVLLDGQGGDETLLGYERFYAYLLKDKLFKFKFKDFVKEYKLASENSRLSIYMLISYFFYFNNPRIRKMKLNLNSKKYLKKDFFGKYKKMNNIINLLYFKSIKEAQKAEINTFISHLLRYEDRNSMAHSIESRVPFLDPNLVETALSIPGENKLKDGWTKALLREYMNDKMPTEVTYRKNKLGFSVPQKLWIDELNEYFKATLLQNPRSVKYFNIEYIKKIFQDKTNENIRFKFIMVETWMRVFDIK